MMTLHKLYAFRKQVTTQVFIALFACVFLLNPGIGKAQFSASEDQKTEDGGRIDDYQNGRSFPEIGSEQKPWTRWWWMGNAVTKEGITAHLELMSEANLGGVEISPIYGVEGYEENTVEYLSPEWMDLLDHTVHEADRLGMSVDMITGSGWPFGGRHVSEEDAARRLVIQTYTLHAGEELSQRVEHVNRNFARKAPLHSLMAYSSDGDRLDLTDRVDDRGHLDWTPGNGNWSLIALFNGWTNMQVKRPAPGESGNVIDHFSDVALENYLERFDRFFSDSPNGVLRGFFNDSFEVMGANWTHDFFDHFENFQNYDLREFLPSFLDIEDMNSTADSLHISSEELRKRIRADFHETIHYLALEQFVIPWVNWANEKGSIARNQAHGFPANILDIYGAADIPEIEIFGQTKFHIPGLRQNEDLLEREDAPNPLVLKFASSAAHVEGRKLASSESGTWLDEHFTVSLSQVKPHLDLQFVSGINHTFYHGTPYSPQDEMWPGWKFYASTHFAPSNSFWNDFGQMNRYVATSQSFLQEGAPANDILLYFPIHDLWHESTRDAGAPVYLRVHNPNDWIFGTPFGRVAEELWNRGYTFDYISDRQLQGVKYREDKLLTGNTAYQTIVVPPVSFIPLETLEQLLKLAEEGATVVFKGGMPESIAGFHNFREKEATLQKMTGSLSFESTGINGVLEATIGNGRFLKGETVRYLLDHANVQREPVVDLGVDFIRRSHWGGHYYFLVNLQGEAVNEWVPLGTSPESVWMVDPMSEEQGFARVRSTDEGLSEVNLQLKPGESRILKTFQNGTEEEPEWSYFRVSGQQIPVQGTWEVDFKEGGPVLPAGFETDSLASWTELGGRDAERFSGTATYRLSFEWPQEEADSWRLDLGRVAESANVRINGEEIGAVWSHPFELNIDSDHLQPGENLLEIDVTNLMLNRVIDLDRRGIRWQKFYDINMVNIDYQRFDSSNWPLMESGLIGPVTLTPLSLQ